MSTGELIPFVFALIGGLGGLVSTLVWSHMVRALNARRNAGDQIPFSLVTWDDFWKHWPIRRLPLLKEFRRDFPDSRLYFLYIAGIVWMYSFVGLAGVLLLASSWSRSSPR